MLNLEISMHDSSPSYNTNQSDYENRVESATNDENPITEAVNADSPEQITEVANAVAVEQSTTYQSPAQQSKQDLAHSLINTFKLLADETRLRLIILLLKNQEMNVRSLCDALSQSQPAVSHHLALLRVAGFVDKRREGKHNFYHVCHEKIKDVLTALFQTVPDRNAFIEFEAFRIEYHPHKATLTQDVSEGQQSKSQSVSS